jgi:predicted O-methyltransferase YrrM
MTRWSSISHGAALIRTHDARGLMEKVVARSRVLHADWRAWRLFRKRRDQEATVEEDLDFLHSLAFGPAKIGFWGQKRSEVGALMRILAAEPPDRVLEIGTARGGTIYLLSRVAHSSATLVTVDLPGAEFGGGYGRDWEPVLRAMPRSTQTLRLVRGDSHDRRTLATLTEIFAPATVDFLLIDGDHRYEGVQQDFEWYSPLVRPGGLIALHDIVPGPEQVVGGVPRFWNEIKLSYESRELVADRLPPHPADLAFAEHHGGWGLGLLKVA